jgi:hypothetical protein
MSGGAGRRPLKGLIDRFKQQPSGLLSPIERQAQSQVDKAHESRSLRDTLSEARARYREKHGAFVDSDDWYRPFVRVKAGAPGSSRKRQLKNARRQMRLVGVSGKGRKYKKHGRQVRAK